ncbi:hypothetical protein [Streptomyces mirabilis]|jgi:hypothetical protein|uniref:Uncharacterized protein n=1 Tax=Streptomyces mirabilis TaxID=68239 RepID=A0A1I2I6U2_9ACTN|nr:hypothetical protein [Streptomyces mirabilis]SFF38189.1 hypothetical protein SAMN02787118_10644 [Streptomyces mirabilis]
MPTLDAETWAEALSMYERRYSYVLVGPREHQDWVRDAAAAMRREVTDPRSWRWLDADEGEEERLEDTFFPFVLPPSDPEGAAAWRRGLRTVPRTSVERLLVVLSTTWLDVPKERARNNFETRRPELERKARVVLSRFPEGTSFYTNAGYPGASTGSAVNAPDFYEAITGCTPVSQYDWDLGLIAVTDTEIGLFWSFDAT